MNKQKISKELLELIRCPVCNKKLKLKKSLLTCGKHNFEIECVPILLPKTLEPEKEYEIAEEAKISKLYKEEREVFLFSKIVNRRWNEAITDLVDSKPKKILEIGCGTGILTRHLLVKFQEASVLSFDLSKEMAGIAAQKNPGKVFVADAERIPLKGNSFDLIVARGVLHHLPRLEKVLKEVSRLLKKNGVFIFSEPNNFNPMFRLYRKFGRKHRGYYPKKLTNILKKNELVVVSESYFGLFTFPFALPDLFKIGSRSKRLWFINFLTRVDILIEKSFLRKLCWHLIFKCKKK